MKQTTENRKTVYHRPRWHPWIESDRLPHEKEVSFSISMKYIWNLSLQYYIYFPEEYFIWTGRTLHLHEEFANLLQVYNNLS